MAVARREKRRSPSSSLLYQMLLSLAGRITPSFPPVAIVRVVHRGRRERADRIDRLIRERVRASAERATAEQREAELERQRKKTSRLLMLRAEIRKTTPGALARLEAALHGAAFDGYPEETVVWTQGGMLRRSRPRGGWQIATVRKPDRRDPNYSYAETHYVLLSTGTIYPEVADDDLALVLASLRRLSDAVPQS